jgi:hypothetical protein
LTSVVTLRADVRRRAGFARLGFSSGADKLGGGASKAGGGAALRGAIAREGSGGDVAPVGCAAPSAVTSKI